MKNTITEVKNTLGGVNNRLNVSEEWIGNLEDRVVEITASEQKKDWKESLKNWKGHFEGPLEHYQAH